MTSQPSTLAPAQEGQWELMCALSPDDPGGSRHISVDNRLIVGPLDRLALWRAFEDVTARHDGLRLTMSSVGWDPVVRIAERREPPVEFLDLGSLPKQRQRERVETLAFHESQRRFDLRSGPLWHSWVIRLAPGRHLMTTVFCHIIADGWSSRVFMEDLLACYGARTGANPPPAGKALSFAEIHSLQADRLRASAERIRYWQDRLTPLPDGPVIPPLGHSTADPHASGTISFQLSPETSHGIQRIAWRARTTPFVALMAAYHLVLSMLAGRDRTVVSTAALNRPTERERTAILQLACDPYVATDLPESMSLSETVRATHDSLADAMRNLMSFKSIAQAVNPGFGAARPWPDCHLFDGNFFSWAITRPRLSVAGLQIDACRISLRQPATHTAELTWAGLSPTGQRAWAAQGGPSMEIGIPRETGFLHYNPEIHPIEMMRDLVRRYVAIAETMAVRPDMTVGALRATVARRLDGNTIPA